MSYTTFSYTVKKDDTYQSIAHYLVKQSDSFSQFADNYAFIQNVENGLKKYRGGKSIKYPSTITLVKEIDFYLCLISINSYVDNQKSIRTKDSINVIGADRKKGINYHFDFQSSDVVFKTNVNNYLNVQIPKNQDFVYELQNNKPSGPVDIYINDQKKQLIPDLSIFKVEKPEDIYIYMGTDGKTANQSVPDFKWNTNFDTLYTSRSDDPETKKEVDSDLIMVIETKTDPGTHIPQGVYSAEQTDSRLLNWIIAELLGTNIPPLMKDIAAMGTASAKRQFLQDLFFKGRFYVKVNPQNGSRYIIFKGYSGLRTHMNASRYLSSNSKVSVISMYVDMASGTKAGVKSSIKSASKGNLIAFAIVGSIDVVEYIFDPSEDKMISDLLIDLGVDFGKVMISGYAGLLAGAGVVAIAAAASVTAPVWLVIGVGLAVSVAVGFGLDALDEHFGFSTGIKEKIKKFYREMNLDQAIKSGVSEFREVWSALSMPEWKIFELRKAILDAPHQLAGRRPSKATSPELIGAIMLDILQEHSDIRIIKSLLDTEAKFIEFYEGSPEKLERWLFKTMSKKKIEDVGLGLAHMTVTTVYDLVENNYLRKESYWSGDKLDIALSWLTEEKRAAVLVGARLARISHYWYSKGKVDISNRPDILGSLYYVGLATSQKVHDNPQPNEAGIRIKALMYKAKLLLGLHPTYTKC